MTTTEMPADYKPSAATIKKFFAPDEKSATFVQELKQLTPQDKLDLSWGIDNGSLTY